MRNHLTNLHEAKLFFQSISLQELICNASFLCPIRATFATENKQGHIRIYYADNCIYVGIESYSGNDTYKALEKFNILDYNNTVNSVIESIFDEKVVA